MKQIVHLSAVVLVASLAATDAYALSNRTFVSGHGSDSNPCSLTAPCRSFAGALAQTSLGGEIAVLDTAGYGPVTITQAVSIINEEGVEAGITVTSGDGVTINVGASDVVNLRGLTLVGAGGSGNGITFGSSGVVNIQNCVIRGFANNGLNLVPTGSAKINVLNTILSDNLFSGILLQPSGTGLTVMASFEQVQAIHNGGDGFSVFGNGMPGGSLRAIAADSLASANGGMGFTASSPTGQATTVFAVANSKAANNSSGVAVAGGQNTTMSLNSSTVAGNTGTGLVSPNGRLFVSGSTVAGNNAACLGGVNSYSNNAIIDIPPIGCTLTPTALR
jgi:hypothetical protein